jgi:hypothetical protein
MRCGIGSIHSSEDVPRASGSWEPARYSCNCSGSGEPARCSCNCSGSGERCAPAIAITSADRGSLHAVAATAPDRGSAARPPPPFAAPLASSLRALSRGDPPHEGAIRPLRRAPTARNGSRGSHRVGFARRDGAEAERGSRRNSSRGSRSGGSRRMSAVQHVRVQHVRGGSPRKRARSEARAEQRTGAGGRRLPRSGALAATARRLLRPGAVIAIAGAQRSPDPETLLR